MKKTNLPCWDCGSSDAACYYSDNDCFFCFSCKKYLNSDQEGFEDHYNSTVLHNNNQENNKYKNNHMNQAPVAPLSYSNEYSFPQKGIITALEDRAISKATAEKYKVETLFDKVTNKPTGRVYQGYDKGNTLQGQKIKPFDPNARIRWVGNNSACTLYGMSFFPAGGKYITITEGEEDALAAYEMLKAHDPRFEPASVSVKDGAGSAVRDCKTNYEYINSFDNIIIAFDGDKNGKEAAEQVAQLFPMKAKIINFYNARKDENGVWQLKDANDYKKAGKQKEFIDLWYKAEKYVPKGVRTFRSLWEDMTKKDTNTVVPFPWEGVNKLVYGMITGKMDVFKAPPKIGKTSVLSELVMHIRDTSPYNVGVIFLENTTKEIGLKFCGIRMNAPLDRPGADINWDELKQVHDDMSKDDRIMIFDPKDERTVENIMKKIVYFTKAHDCKYIFLDHASMLAYTSEDGDERKFLDKLFADLKQMTTSLDIYLGVVIHVNDDGKTRGSRAPVQLCDRLFSLYRDKLNTDPVVKNTTDFIVEENRWGECGTASKLFYDQNTGRMTEMDMEQVSKFNEAKDKAQADALMEM